jgi:hypothetical protein
LTLQITPGPKVYQGKHDPPVGPQLAVRETGAFTGTQAQSYDRAVASADTVLHSIVSGVNTVLPGGGGYHYDVGQGAYNAPVNGGKSVAPVGSLYAGNLLPTGVVPDVGHVGSDPKKSGQTNAAPPSKATKAKQATPPAGAATRMVRC